VNSYLARGRPADAGQTFFSHFRPSGYFTTKYGVVKLFYKQIWNNSWWEKSWLDDGRWQKLPDRVQFAAVSDKLAPA
jgi:hypothetical protein